MECCFAALWERAVYCYETFGVNQDNFLLKNNDGVLFEAVERDLSHERSIKIIIA
jgi:hypothetical protein